MKITATLLITLFPLLAFAETQQLDGAYYSKLRQGCRNNSQSMLNDDNCCLASVDHMEQRKAILLDPALNASCPAGTSKNMLRCMSTYQWCEPDGSQPPAEPKANPEEAKPVEAKPEEPKAALQTEIKPEETKEAPKAETK